MQECVRPCPHRRRDDDCASESEPAPEDEAPAGLERPNACPLPSGVRSEEYFQRHPADRQSDTDDSQEQDRGMPPRSRWTPATGTAG